jgi:hypothetical protein
MSIAAALPVSTVPIYARSSVDRALADRPLDAPDNSRAWLEALRAEGVRRDNAIAELHELLLRAARFEIGRRRAAREVDSIEVKRLAAGKTITVTVRGLPFVLEVGAGANAKGVAEEFERARAAV